MSKHKFIILLLALASLLALEACEKDTTANVSKVFTVPVITVNGEKAISIPVGGSFTDEGAKYIGETGEETTLQATSSNVNTNEPGLYVVRYKKTSESGIYETEGERVVVVSSVNNPIDYSGIYLRPATGVNVYITKVANGLYRVQNPGGFGGAPGTNIYFAEIAPNTFVAPTQLTEEGEMEVTEINFILDAGAPIGATWRVLNDNYGTGLRTFEKVE